MHARVYIYMHIYMCVYIGMHICVLMWHACVGTRADTYKYVCIHTRVCVHIMCVFNRNKGSFGEFICVFFLIFQGWKGHASHLVCRRTPQT